MIGTFVGLGLTIIGSAWLYKSAKIGNNRAKNEYFNFIQANVLATTNSNLSSSLNSLNYRLKSFGQTFDKSIDKLYQSSGNIESVSNNQLLSLQQQKEVIDEIRRIGIAEISNASLEIFKHLKNSMEVFEKLSNKIQPMLGLVEQNNENLTKIDKVYSRLANFNGKLQKVLDNIYNTTVDAKELGSFLKAHYTSIQYLSEGTRELVNEQKKVLSGENETFKLFLNEKQQKYTEVLDRHLNDFSSQLQKIGDKSKELVTDQIKGLEDLTGSFDKLLVKNKEFLTDKVKEMQTEWEKSLKETLSETKIESLEINIKELKNEFSIQNKTLIQIAQSIKEQSNPVDEEIQQAIRVIGEYYKKKIMRKEKLRRLIFWRS